MTKKEIEEQIKRENKKIEEKREKLDKKINKRRRKLGIRDVYKYYVEEDVAYFKKKFKLNDGDIVCKFTNIPCFSIKYSRTLKKYILECPSSFNDDEKITSSNYERMCIFCAIAHEFGHLMYGDLIKGRNWVQYKLLCILKEERADIYAKRMVAERFKNISLYGDKQKWDIVFSWVESDNPHLKNGKIVERYLETKTRKKVVKNFSKYDNNLVIDLFEKKDLGVERSYNKAIEYVCRHYCNNYEKKIWGLRLLDPENKWVHRYL